MKKNLLPPEKITQDHFLKNLGIEKSFLKFWNFGSSVSEYLEINMPYMILYESVSNQQDKAITFEFTESRKDYIYSTLSALDVLGERPLHFHDFYELTFVISGEVTLQIEDEFVTYGAGECCLCNRNIHHREIRNHDFEIVLFMFKEEYIKSVLEDDEMYDDNGNLSYHETIFHQFIKKNENSSFYAAKEYLDFRLAAEFKLDLFLSQINTILLELNEKKPGRSYLMKGYFCRFIAFLTDPSMYSSSFRQTNLSKEAELIYKVSMLLEESHCRISRTEIEKKLNYSGDYINRVIKKQTGKTLSEYKADFLLKEACQLLLETDLNIAEICEYLGYSNRHFFNKLFTDRFGVSPSKFRSSHISDRA